MATPRPDFVEPKVGWCFDKSIVDKRTKVIERVKSTSPYKRYYREVPRKSRIRNIHPRTPNKYLNHSRRSWEAQMKNWKRSLHTWPERYFEKLKMSEYYNEMAMNHPYLPYMAPFSTSYGYPMMVPHPSYVASISPLPTTYMNGIDNFMQNQVPYFDSSIRTESTLQSKNRSPLCSRCKSEPSSNSLQTDVNEKPEVTKLTSSCIEKFEFSIDSSNSRSSVFPFTLDDSSLSISTRNRSSLLELSGYKQNMDSPSAKEDVVKGGISWDNSLNLDSSYDLGASTQNKDLLNPSEKNVAKEAISKDIGFDWGAAKFLAEFANLTV